MLSNSKQLYSATNIVYAYIKIVYNKVSDFSPFKGNNITSLFYNISKLKKKLTG